MSGEGDKLCHPFRCHGDPTKLHHMVREIMECPACRPEFDKAFQERGWKIIPKKDYSKIYIC